MAVGSVSFPTPQAYSGGADFTPLANLGNVYQQAQDRDRRLAALAKLGTDPTANAQALIQSQDPQLAAQGINLQNTQIQQQRQAAQDAEAKREFELNFAQTKERNERLNMTAAEKAAETEEMLTKQGIDPKSPYGQQIITGIDPNAATRADKEAQIRQQAAQIAQSQEGRAQTKFQQEQQTATPQQRYNTVQEGIKSGVYPPEALKDPSLQNWIRYGDPASGRQSLGTPTWARDAEGKLHQYQLSSTGQPVEVQLPQGQTPLGPGEVAAQKQEGVSMAKARIAAATALPRISDNITTNISDLDKVANHPGREGATGKYYGQLADDSMLLSQQGIDFRNQFRHVKAQSFLQAFDTLRGAGAISDREGAKGTEAINRLSTVTSKDEFDSALKEAKEVYQLGLDRARRAAKGDFSEHPPELRPSDYAAAPQAAPTSQAAPAPSGPTDWKTYFGKQ